MEDFVGRQETAQDTADAHRMAGLAALLDRAAPTDVLPPLGHWLCFQPQVAQARIGADGHPIRDGGGLLPAIDLPRRMWAGSRVAFLADIPLGASIERRSTLIAATPKTGRSGRMLFATIRHEIGVGGAAAAIVEEQDIVYREAIASSAIAQSAPIEGALATIVPDSVMLFRYSALTFNAHRIHYDRDYARDVEGYPGLVVHGPLTATLLLDALLRQRPGFRVGGFAFRAEAPMFEDEPIGLMIDDEADGVALTAIGPRGPAMRATASPRT